MKVVERRIRRHERLVRIDRLDGRMKVLADLAELDLSIGGYMELAMGQWDEPVEGEGTEDEESLFNLLSDNSPLSANDSGVGCRGSVIEVSLSFVFLWYRVVI